MMPAGGGGYARAGTPDQDREWFPVRLTAASGTTTAGKVEFVGYEVWNDPTGATVEVVGGRVLSASQPGVFLGDAPGPYADAVPMLAQARLGPGSGGRLWELAAFGASAGNTGPTNCRRRLLGLVDADCVRFSVGAGAGLCANVEGETLTGVRIGDYWYSLGTFTTAAGEARVRFRVKPFELDLVVAGVTYEGLEVGCGAGALVYAFSDAALCDDESAGACGDNTFTVSVGCDGCDELQCCPPEDLPDDLCLAVTVAAGSCDCVAETYTLTRPVAGEGLGWYSERFVNSCGTPAYTHLEWRLTCVGDHWELHLFASNDGAGGADLWIATGLYDCSDPVSIAFGPLAGTALGEDCDSGYTLSAVVYETDEGGECASGSGSGSPLDPPGDIGCCDGVGESLEAHPSLELVIPDGPNAGTYPLVDNGYQWVHLAGTPPIGLFCLYGAWRLAVIGSGSRSGVGYAASGSCDPFGLVFAGAEFDATGDITASVL